MIAITSLCLTKYTAHKLERLRPPREHAQHYGRKGSKGNWGDEKIQLLLDGEQYWETRAWEMGNEERWAFVSHQGPFTGPDVGLALKYVAVYFDDE